MEDFEKSKKPIAVIDSGLGGLSVLKVLRRELPHENYIYFGDSANAPYGEKSGDEVRRITDENIGMLRDGGAKAVVIACNTATSAAAEYVREKYSDIPIIGMEPAVKPAAMMAQHPKVVVMATPLTLVREKFLRLIEKYSDKAEFVCVPCHGLVELVERGVVEGEEMDKCLFDILSPYTDGAGVDAVVLGCTHYVHAAKAIEKALGGNVEIFDGVLGTVREVERRLSAEGLLNTSDEIGKLTICNSSDDEDFIRRSNMLLEL